MFRADFHTRCDFSKITIEIKPILPGIPRKYRDLCYKDCSQEKHKLRHTTKHIYTTTRLLTNILQRLPDSGNMTP